MANKIRKVPLRTEELFCSISSEVVMMASVVSRAGRVGSAMPGTASKHSKPSS